VKPLFRYLSDTINARPALVAGLFFALILLAFYGTGFLHMATGSETYLDKSTRQGVIMEQYQDTFRTNNIMVIIESDDVVDPDTLLMIDQLSWSLQRERYVASASGITDLIRMMNGGTIPRSTGEISQILDNAPPDILDRVYPSNMMTILIVSLEPGTSSDVRESILRNFETIIGMTDLPPGTTVTLSGDAAFAQQMKEEMRTSMGVLIGAAMILMIIAVMLLFSHVSYRLLPVGVVAIGLLLTFGMMGLFDIPISMVTIGAFPVLIGIGIDYAIQFHSRLDEELRRQPMAGAICSTLTKTGPAVFYAMIATSMGFIAMMVSPVPMVRDFGLVCVIGVVFCYIAALIIVPTFGILIGYTPKPLKGEGGLMKRYNNLLGRLATKIARVPIPVILVLGLVALAGVQMDTYVPISTDEHTFVPDDMPAVVDIKKVTRTMGSTLTLPIYISGDTVLSPEGIRWIDEYGEYAVAKHGEITRVQSITTYMRTYNDGQLPETRTEIRAVLERIPEDTKKLYINGNNEAVIQFSLLQMETDQQKSLVDQVRSDLLFIEPPVGISATPTGSVELFTTLIDDIRKGKTYMTLLGFLLIFGFLLLIYRKAKLALTPLVPIIMIVGWNGLIMYTLHIDYTPLTATLGSMAIGIACEYTILIMERCQEELDKGLPLYDAINTSVAQIGSAITVSGLTTVFGFSALLLSSFNIISNFGMVTVITVGFSLIGAIIVMPAVLAIANRDAIAR